MLPQNAEWCKKCHFFTPLGPSVTGWMFLHLHVEIPSSRPTTLVPGCGSASFSPVSQSILLCLLFNASESPYQAISLPLLALPSSHTVTATSCNRDLLPVKSLSENTKAAMHLHNRTKWTTHRPCAHTCVGIHTSYVPEIHKQPASQSIFYKTRQQIHITAENVRKWSITLTYWLQ
jgi:hypothetical protein